MKRVALLFSIVASISMAAAQGTSVHMSSNDSVSWALIRVSGGGKASVGDMQGIHIGEVTQDEFIFVKDGKGFVVTDSKVLADVEAARGPLDKFREVRTAAKSESREERLKQRSVERELQGVERQRERLNRSSDRADENEKKEIARELKELERRQSALVAIRDEAAQKLEIANKRLAEVEKQMDTLREQVQKRTEQIFEAARAKGLAKPIN